MRNLILPLRTDKSGFLNIWSIGVKYMPGKYVRVLNRNAMIAALLGAVLLMVSYFGVPENSFWHNLTHEIGFALLVAVTIWGHF